MKDLFVKSTGETSDIVEKEMFSLQDQGGRDLALRPEGTPGIVRAYINNNLSQEGHASKLFYIGSMFRAERPQAGRYREFEQIGVESLGNGHPAADAECILALRHFLESVGLAGKTRLRLNNIGCDEDPSCRPAYRKELRAFLDARSGELCDNCRRRMDRNPLRALDCKKDGPKLSENAPRLRPCGKCRVHVETVSRLLEENACGHVFPDSNLVRGLDYYTSTVFEFQADGIGAQDAVAGGGRYDTLVASMGGKPTPAVGWALGVERLLMAVLAHDSSGSSLAKISAPPKTDVYLVLATKDAEAVSKGVEIIESLRRFGIRAGGGLFSLSLKAQMREAGRQQVRYTVVLGEDELKKSPPTCKLKDMESGAQEDVALTDLLENIGNKLSKSELDLPQGA